MKRYNPKELEPKWQAAWAADKIYEAVDSSDKPKKYVLEYFPYPSGAAMHVGHVRNYTIGDAVARHARMTGHNVLHPMGWDAFGLPAENYAIKNGISPKQAIAENTAKFKKQLMQMGFSYDWSREINSSDPRYYKWTQWFFLLLLERGLAYQKDSLQWWCDTDKTVLANEQVEAGRCWRCGNLVVKKPLKQWFFKITDYADRLSADLDTLDWSDAIKTMQRNWIGRSEGAEVDFRVADTSNYVLLHGFMGSPSGDFLPWLKAELEKTGATVTVPALPNPDKPDADEQAAYLLDNVKFDANTVLLGHSYGSMTALKVLEKLKQPIKQTVLVSGFERPGFLDHERNFEGTTKWTVDYDRVKHNAGQVMLLRPNNDSAVPRERADQLQAALGGRIVNFTAEADHACGTTEPVILQNVLPKITVFTTRPDTLFGATFMVLAPEHPLVKTITTDKQRPMVENYVQEAAKKSDVERQENKQKTGVFTGAYAVNPVNDDKIPVWIADYVLMGYGTGAIMAVPAHDERDYEFAKAFDLPVQPVIAPVYLGRHPDIVMEQATDRPAVLALAYDPKPGKYCLIEWHTDHHRAGLEWPGGGVDEGESLEQAVLREFTEETGYTDVRVERILPGSGTMYFVSGEGQQKRNVFRYVQVTLNSNAHNGVVGSEDYEKNNYDVLWLTKDQILSRLDDMPLPYRLAAEQLFLGTIYSSKEGVLVNSGDYNNMPAAEAREKIVSDLEEKGQAKAVTNYKIRDWLISRQRYWGAPIPVIHCPNDGIVPVPDNQLPVVLPEVESYAPTGEGTSVLASVKDWVNVDCPKCGGPAKRETDTMDGFACSSWYFLRFADPHNDQKPFDKSKVDYWLPVDDYIGGAEHAVMHLLYARMWTKVMHDAGLIDFDEPFKALRNQGMILAPDGRKMSKSWGNTITPDEIIEQGYGADAVRVMELFIGPWNQKANWSVEGMGGCFRFLQRIWTLTQEFLESPSTEAKNADTARLQRTTHAAIKRVSEDLSDMGFNTAIAALMEAVNELYKIKAEQGFAAADAWRQSLSSLLQLLAPFAPHITEELWADLGHEQSIHLSDWPAYDPQYLVEDKLTIAIQVNGKLRGEVQVAVDAQENQITAAAQALPAVAAQLAGKTIRKTVYVPKKLINFVA